MSKKLCKSYVCVFLGCNKNEPRVIDVVTEKHLDEFIINLGGNPKEEILEKDEKICSDPKVTKEELEAWAGSFMPLDCPEDVKYKIFAIKPYEFVGKLCKCPFIELVYCVQKEKYSVEKIVGWVKGIVV